MDISEVLGQFESVVAWLGGGAVLVLALLTYLGGIHSKRILLEQNSDILHKLELVKSEMSLNQTSYENQLDHIVNYYTTYYEHYRICQQLASFEAYGSPTKADICTKDLFMEKVDTFVLDWEKIEPRIRLILSPLAFELHGQAIDEFNEFNKLVRKLNKNDYDEKEEIRASFVKIHEIKNLMEQQLRSYLRTDKIA
ncbi:MAG: hypothetical protein HRU23_20365 [Gammaproteobacteria bacterium]|nr:hypothetical protein [Gammaproteobacteria bacterium]